MEPLENKVQQLIWKTLARDSTWDLLSGSRCVGKFKWSAIDVTEAVGTAASGTWILQDRGLFRRRMEVRTPDRKERIAVMKPAEGEAEVITFTDGTNFVWRPTGRREGETGIYNEQEMLMMALVVTVLSEESIDATVTVESHHVSSNHISILLFLHFFHVLLQVAFERKHELFWKEAIKRKVSYRL